MQTRCHVLEVERSLVGGVAGVFLFEMSARVSAALAPAGYHEIRGVIRKFSRPALVRTKPGAVFAGLAGVCVVRPSTKNI